MTTSIGATIEGHRDAITVKRVFGDPYERNGVTVIPAAKVMGGGGGGEGTDPGGETIVGSGSGFGLVARPAGAYVIRGDEVTWQPAVDVNRIVAGAFALAALAMVLGRRRSRRRGG
jgi:uncharacterized spore protein YtfJ